MTQCQSIEAVRLAQCLADSSRQQYTNYIHTHLGEALLLHYMNDGWSAWTATHKTAYLGSKKYRVQQRRRTAFCLEMALIRSSRSQCDAVMLNDRWTASPYV